VLAGLHRLLDRQRAQAQAGGGAAIFAVHHRAPRPHHAGLLDDFVSDTIPFNGLGTDLAHGHRGNWSATVTFKQGHELVQAGPYRFVRHPIYTGILLMILSSAIVQGRLQSWLGFLIMCAGFWIKLKQEESLMLRHFPDEYPAYRARVKALVPFLI
jgi:hypothetical protein